MHTHTHTYFMLNHIHTCIHPYMQAYTYTHKKYIFICPPTRPNIYIHTYIVYNNTHTHTFTHMHSPTHPHIIVTHNTHPYTYGYKVLKSQREPPSKKVILGNALILIFPKQSFLFGHQKACARITTILNTNSFWIPKLQEQISLIQCDP